MKVYVTLWFKDFRRRDLLNEVIGGDFDGFELSLDYPLCKQTRLGEIPRLGDLMRSGLETSIHLPWREVYLASPVEEVRRVSLDYVVECFEEACGIEPRYAIVHAVTDQAVCSDDPGICISASMKSLETLVEVAERLGVPLYVETTRNFCCGGLEQAVNYLERGVALCLDIPHAIERYSRLYRKPLSLSEILRDAPPKALEAVECVHFHGYVMNGYYVVESHIEPDRRLLEEYLGILRKNVLKPRYTVLESFYSASSKKFIKFNELRWCVDEIKKDRSWNR